MNSPCLPAARAEPATATSATAQATAAQVRTGSEVSSQLDTARTDHRSAALQARETARRSAGVCLGRVAANREVKDGAKHQAGATDRKSNGRDRAFLLGRVDGSFAARRAAVVRAL